MMDPAGTAPSSTPARRTHSPCPHPNELAQHARGDTTVDVAVRLDQHLHECPTCLHAYLQNAQPLSVAPNIPDFRVVAEIGRGRFGVVYKAWWRKDHPKLVALKVLSGSGRMERSRFEREIAVLKKIDSPGIVKCLAAGTTADAAYYVMEFVHGCHLDEYITDSTDSLVQKLRVFQAVCQAVADAHAAGVVHRDLKPRNIVVDQHARPHILDFGICSLETPDWSSWIRQTITRAGDIIGTLRYMSPEQAWGGVAGPIDERSDIWSLGLMLYEIVTGGDYPYSLRGTPEKPPHEHLLDQIRKELPRLPGLDHLPRGRDLEILLERCLAWEPDERIQSVAQLCTDLDRYCRRQRILTRPLPIRHRIKRLAVGAATRYRWACSAALVATLALLLWSTVFLFHAGWHVPGTAHLDQKLRAAAETGNPSARDAIRIVGISDESVDAVRDWAKQNDLPGVTSEVTTWRGVHGRLMQRLAHLKQKPRAVVWDYFFRKPRPDDDQLIAGIQELEETGVPVLLAAAGYTPDGTPILSTTITEALGPRLRHGGIVARDMTRRPGEFVLALRPDDSNVIVPGLALTTLAAIIHPHARLDLDWRGREKRISLLYELRPGAYLRRRDRVELTSVFPAGRRQSAARPDDLLGCGRYALQAPRAWMTRTLPYEALLTGPDDAFHDELTGRIVIFGDMRTDASTPVPDRHRVKYGLSIQDDVPGCYLLADAVAGLLDGGYLRSAFPLPAGTFLTMMLIAGAGCALAVGLARLGFVQHRRDRRLIWALIVGGGTACWIAVILARNVAAVHLGLAGVSLALPLAGSLWVELARNRHRILERKRQAVERLDAPLEGTLTLATLRRTSLPTAG